jgi:hypothetical protein
MYAYNIQHRSHYYTQCLSQIGYVSYITGTFICNNINIKTNDVCRTTKKNTHLQHVCSTAHCNVIKCWLFDEYSSLKPLSYKESIFGRNAFICNNWIRNDTSHLLQTRSSEWWIHLQQPGAPDQTRNSVRYLVLFQSRCETDLRQTLWRPTVISKDDWNTRQGGQFSKLNSTNLPHINANNLRSRVILSTIQLRHILVQVYCVLSIRVTHMNFSFDGPESCSADQKLSPHPFMKPEDYHVHKSLSFDRVLRQMTLHIFTSYSLSPVQY